MKTIYRVRFLFYLLILSVILFLTGVFQSASAQSGKLPISKRESVRRGMRSRDSVLRTLNRSDTSINSLLQRIEQYTTTLNQINNNLSDGLDTADIHSQMPVVIRRIGKMDSLAKTHKSSTLRYLFVLRDNLDHIREQLEDWQSDMDDMNASLVQNQKDLLKIEKDTTLKAAPTDSALRLAYFQHLIAIKALWHRTDSVNRKTLLKVNFLQDKISISYNRILDETDQIDSKIKRFAMKAIAGESDYIWNTGADFAGFKSAFKSTLKVNTILFTYLIKNNTYTHFGALLFFVVVLGWVFYNRAKTIRNNTDADVVFERARYIQKDPALSSLLIALSIIPYFYDHPPAVYLELLFLTAIIITLFFVKAEHPKMYHFLFQLFWITLVYSASNLFIQISNLDRYAIFLLSIASIVIGFSALKKVQKSPGDHINGCGAVLIIFIGFHIISLVFNLSGRFSLAKIIGITAVFNLWLLVIFYLLVQIILQCLYLQFQTPKDANNVISWIDFNAVEKKFRSIIITITTLLWTFTFLQNLNLDDSVQDWLSDTLSASHSVGGASFTFGGFVIFIAVIWLSSVASRVISYFYDVSSKRSTDQISAKKKKNKTSALLIRLSVFSVGFLLAVFASGFPLDKITIIISAFGIGIGFGLQNIVNNLVSGLILAFEKPVTVGDIIEVDGHSGSITDIGIRSSRIATSDGAEVIVPNGDLIAHHVINWTLSNNNRRIELIVSVAYGADIPKVKEVLSNLLTGAEEIMNDPAPIVLVHKLSESSVDFRMLFWAGDISTWLQLKSRVLTDIYHKLTEAGIVLPRNDVFVHLPDGGTVTVDQVNSAERDEEKNA